MAIAVLLASAPVLHAQTSDTDASTQASAEATDEAGLLTQAELETLVAPVALYPDTLLIQILVAATNPLEVVKADRLLATTDQSDPQVLKAAVEAEGYDPSVEVLATAFPEVITDMAAHIEWTESMGDAMLAQSDDVQTAIQTMRAQAINSGALVDGEGEQQTVEVSNDNNVVITPTDPQVVYVPQYDPQVVYQQDPQVVYQQNDSNAVGDALMVGAVTFGAVALMDAIFDDDDDWGGDYWGCRDCGGWGGGPIYRNPDVDIDVDGNVNIGNRVDIDRDKANIDKDRWGDRDPDGGWKPDKDRQDKARDDIARKRGDGSKTKLPIDKKDSAQRDKLRKDLSANAGAADITRPGSAAQVRDLQGKAPNAGKHREAIAKTGKGPANAKKPAGAKKPAAKNVAAKAPAVKKPAAHKAPAKAPAARQAAHKKPTALAKKAPAKQAKAASHRGRSSGGGGGGKRRR